MKNISVRASKKMIARKQLSVRKHELKRAEERRLLKTMSREDQTKRKIKIAKRVEDNKIKQARLKIEKKMRKQGGLAKTV